MILVNKINLQSKQRNILRDSLKVNVILTEQFRIVAVTIRFKFTAVG